MNINPINLNFRGTVTDNRKCNMHNDKQQWSQIANEYVEKHPESDITLEKGGAYCKEKLDSGYNEYEVIIKDGKVIHSGTGNVLYTSNNFDRKRAYGGGEVLA